MKTRVCLKYFVNDCHWKQFSVSVSNSLHILLNLTSFTIFVTLTFFTQKFKQLNCKKLLKFALIANRFSDFLIKSKLGTERRSSLFQDGF